MIGQFQVGEISSGLSVHMAAEPACLKVHRNAIKCVSLLQVDYADKR